MRMEKETFERQSIDFQFAKSRRNNFFVLVQFFFWRKLFYLSSSMEDVVVVVHMFFQTRFFLAQKHKEEWNWSFLLREAIKSTAVLAYVEFESRLKKLSLKRSLCVYQFKSRFSTIIRIRVIKHIFLQHLNTTRNLIWITRPMRTRMNNRSHYCNLNFLPRPKHLKWNLDIP